MKIDKIYMFNNINEIHDAANGKLIILYEYIDKTEYEKALKEIDSYNNRHTCFISNGMYYVGEYLTAEIKKDLIKNNVIHRISKGIQFKDLIMFHVVLQEYGDMLYYFNNNDKKFYYDYINIGD